MEHTHDGHRKRMRERILANGPESLQPHELVEFLLFYAIPRRNVNPLAHQLLDHFDTLQNLYSATMEDLLQVDGVNPQTAEYLTRIGAAVLEYMQPDAKPILLKNRRLTTGYLRRFYADPAVQGCWMFCLNITGQLIHTLALNDTPEWYSAAHMRKAIAQALQCRAHSVIIARREAASVLTEEDRRHTTELMRAFSGMEIALVEHIVMDAAGRSVIYATDPNLVQRHIASPSPLLAHWLDEEPDDE